MDSTVLKKRVFVGGLPADITSAELADRLRPFGAVGGVQLAKDQMGGTEQCRGFGHVDLETTAAQWQRCLSVYNGSSWRGSRLRIEEARPDYRQRLVPREGAVVRRRLVRHAKDMSLVTDKNVGGRRGWRKARYGRAVAMVRVRRPDGRLVVHDPLHFKSSLEKLFGSVKPLPVARLAWTWDRQSSSRVSVAGVLFDSSSQPFSLSLKLGLPVAVPAKPEPLMSRDTKGTESAMKSPSALKNPSALKSPIESAKDSKKDTLDLFYDFDQAEFKSRNYLFCQRPETMQMWKERRAEIRRDFKQQIKQAKRLDRRNISRHHQ